MPPTPARLQEASLKALTGAAVPGFTPKELADASALNESTEPRSVEVLVTVKAAVYRTDGDLVFGDDRKRRDLRFVWTLELRQNDGEPPNWKLVGSHEVD